MMDTRNVGVSIRWWHIGLLLLVALPLRLVFLVGMTGSDDLKYAQQARLMSEGSFNPGSYFANFRVGLIAPTALAYRLFGVSTASTVWFAMFCSLLGVLAAYLVGKELFGPVAGFWAGMVYAVLPIDVVVAGILMPDICVAALTGLALVCVLRGERATTMSGRTALFVLAGILTGAGYLCKMTALMTMGILVLYIILRRKSIPYIASMLGGLGIVLLLEGVFYRLTQGQFFYRIGIVGGWNHAMADGMLAGQLASLSEYPRTMFVSIEEFGFFWYLLVAAAIWATVTRLRRAWVVALWVVPLWLTLQFGIASLTQLTFPAHVPRYLTLVTIPAAALIGAMFARLAERRRRVALGLLTIGTVLSSLFFAGLQATLVESKVWNAREAARRLKELPERPTYVLLGRGTIDWSAGPGKLDLRAIYRKHDPVSGLDSDPHPPEELVGSYVVVDYRLIGFYRERLELKLPDYLEEVPPTWTQAALIRNDYHAIRYIPVRLVQWTLDKHLLPRPLASRFARTLAKVMEHNECVIYAVPDAAGASSPEGH